MSFEWEETVELGLENLSDYRKMRCLWRTFARLAASQIREPEEGAYEGPDGDAFFNAKEIFDGNSDNISVLTDDLKVKDKYVYDRSKKICGLIDELFLHFTHQQE